MPELPLLILPTAEVVTPLSQTGRGDKVNSPSIARQSARLGPKFSRLKAILDKSDSAIELKKDPTGLAPDRVIDFETAGTVRDLERAISKIPGLELLIEQEFVTSADDDFAIYDSQKDEVRKDKPLKGRLYLAMPDVQALREMLSLWERWQRQEPMERGRTPIRELFELLKDVRPWGPLDRIPEESIRYWQEEVSQSPSQSILLDVELWFHTSISRRDQAFRDFLSALDESGGTLLDEAVIPEISYHGALVEVPRNQVMALTQRSGISLVLCDEVMFLRPQSLFRSSPVPEILVASSSDVLPASFANDSPVVGLLDGVPLSGHVLLAGRLIVDDPDSLESIATLPRRLHATSMASLLLHGDRNLPETPLSRPIYVRPIMYSTDDRDESTDPSKLLVDTIYKAIIRMKGTNSSPGSAPSVFLVNLSLGDERRPFAGLMSPLARLLDYLSYKHNLLFLISSGNVRDALKVPTFANWSDFEGASEDDRTNAIVSALNLSKHERTLIAPAESVNSLTIGAAHSDHIANRSTAPRDVDPLDDPSLPNISSGMGLGYRRAIKPELFFPGGREHVRLKGFGSVLEIKSAPERSIYGLKVATPDSSGLGSLSKEFLLSGTSVATALASRAAHQVFDALMDEAGGSRHYDMNPEFYAVVVKALLAHRAKWKESAALIGNICGPHGQSKGAEKSENICRFIGYGIPDIREAQECASNRATLVGYGAISSTGAHEYSVPLPPCLMGITNPRALTVTLAWLSPVRAGSQRYRGVKLEVTTKGDLGVTRGNASQPRDYITERGTLFHVLMKGAQAIPFVEAGHLSLQVVRREDAGSPDDLVRYGLAVTIETETDLPVYNEVANRLQITPNHGFSLILQSILR